MQNALADVEDHWNANTAASYHKRISTFSDHRFRNQEWAAEKRLWILDPSPVVSRLGRPRQSRPSTRPQRTTAAAVQACSRASDNRLSREQVWYGTICELEQLSEQVEESVPVLMGQGAADAFAFSSLSCVLASISRVTVAGCRKMTRNGL